MRRDMGVTLGLLAVAGLLFLLPADTFSIKVGRSLFFVSGAVISAAIGYLCMAMAVKATTAPTPPEGMLLMLAFGAGTLPSMLFASVLFGKLGPKLRGGLQKLAALFVIALGVSTLWQGLRFYLVMYKLVV